jgi:hypothetical protein
MATPSPSVPYKIIADCFRSSTVVLFLGSAASFVGASKDASLPSGAMFARTLAEKGDYPGAQSDPLTKVAQYIEEIPADRNYLLSTVYERFFSTIQPGYSSALTDFLTQIPVSMVPKLIVTTNYDVLVERTLEEKGLPYLAISHIMKGPKSGRLLCYTNLRDLLGPANIKTLSETEEFLLEAETDGNSPALIYKMHGSAWLRFGSTLMDSVVLTENDYIEFFAQDVLNRIPTRIVETLRTSRLLFLGYALEDWNFRVLLRKLQAVQRQNTDNVQRHWAFLLDADPVEVKFWENRGVNLYRQSLDITLNSLLHNLK